MLDGVFTRRSKTSVDSENYEVRRFVNIFYISPHFHFDRIPVLCGEGGQYGVFDSTSVLTVRVLYCSAPFDETGFTVHC